MLQSILEKIDKITPRDKKISILAVTKNRTVSDIIPLYITGSRPHEIIKLSYKDNKKPPSL